MQASQRLLELYGRRVAPMVIIVGVGVSAFAAGQLAAYQARTPPVTIEYTRPHDDGGYDARFVGSVHSDLYHFPWCPGARRIDTDNRITFASRQEASRAGYTPASNCPGLKKAP